MTTALGVLILIVAFGVKYGGGLASSIAKGAAWLWSNRPSFSLPTVSNIAAKSKPPTSTETFSALALIQDFKTNATADPNYKLIMAALKEVTA